MQWTIQRFVTLLLVLQTIERVYPRLLPWNLFNEERSARKTHLEEIVCHVADISFVIDSSRSIYPPDFEKGLEFLSNFINHFEIGPDRVRVSAVLFGGVVFENTAFGFNSYLSNKKLSDAILNLRFMAGDQTATGQALKYMREKQMVTARPDVENIAVVLTDGMSTDNRLTVTEAKKTKAAGIKIIAIGVGPYTDRKELLAIASSEDTMFQVASYNSLDSIMGAVGDQTCVVEVVDDATCGEKSPSDIYFVFDSPYIGGAGSEKCVQFIESVVSQEEMDDGMQIGVISGRCDDVSGFELDRYDDVTDMKTHMSKYSHSNLSGLVEELNASGYTPENGGRTNALKIGVLFVSGKYPEDELKRRTQEAVDNNVTLYIVNLGDVDPEKLSELSYSPSDDYVLSGKPMEELAREFVDKLCRDV